MNSSVVLGAPTGAEHHRIDSHTCAARPVMLGSRTGGVARVQVDDLASAFAKRGIRAAHVMG